MLREQVGKFVENGDFGFASGQQTDGTYERVWHAEPLPPEEIVFESGVFLLMKKKAKALKSGAEPPVQPPQSPTPEPETGPEPTPGPEPEPAPVPQSRILRLVGTVPPEVWNRIGTKVLPKLRSGNGLTIGVEFSVTLKPELAASLESELLQALQDLGLTDRIRIEHGE